MFTPNRASAVRASAVLPTTRRPYAAGFHGPASRSSVRTASDLRRDRPETGFRLSARVG